MKHLIWVHEMLLVPCIKGCGRKVKRNLDREHGICVLCWENAQ